MINGLEIENYKCFRHRTFVPLAPITVLVGQNSSGKSTVLNLIAALTQTERADGDEMSALLPRRVEGGMADLGPVDRIFHQGLVSDAIGIGFRFPSDAWPHDVLLRVRISPSVQSAFARLIATRYEFSDPLRGEILFCIESDDPPEVVELNDVSDGYESRTESIARIRCPVVTDAPEFWELLRIQVLHAQAANANLSVWRRRLREESEAGHLLARMEQSIKNMSPPEFAIKAAAETSGDQRGVLMKHFYAPKLCFQGPYSLLDMPQSMIWKDAFSSINGFFSHVDWFSPVRGAPARDVVIDTAEPGGGRWEDATNALHALAQDSDLRGEVSGWLAHLTGHSLECEDVAGRGVKVKLRDEWMGSDVLLDLADVGYGITHLLPIVTMLMSKKERVVLVSQPETHVHPSLQAELGEMFVHAWELRKTRCIVETHSEHLIRRLQRRVRGGRLKPEDVAILYVDRTPEGSTVTHLRMDSCGDFIDNWPKGFFPEALNETLGE